MAGKSDADVMAASLREPGRFGALFDRHATVVFRYAMAPTFTSRPPSVAALRIASATSLGSMSGGGSFGSLSM